LLLPEEVQEEITVLSYLGEEIPPLCSSIPSVTARTWGN